MRHTRTVDADRTASELPSRCAPVNRALKLLRDGDVASPIDEKAELCARIDRALDGEIERHDGLLGDGETLVKVVLAPGKALLIRCPTEAMSEEAAWLIRETGAAMRERLLLIR